MERKRNSKIRKYFIFYLIFFVFFSSFMFFLARHETSLDRQRMLALISSHPELEAEILSAWEKPDSPLPLRESSSDGMDKTSQILDRVEKKYGYSSNFLESAKELWMFWGIGLCAGTLLIAALWYQSRREEEALQNSLQDLYECLEQFREGWFTDIPDYENNPETDTGEWMHIWESLRELGIYFESLRQALKKEESHTKSLITDISHQLKTPLASLKMCHELASASPLSQDEQREFQEQEAREIEKLEILLKELVNLSRLETNMIQLDSVSASLKDTISGAVSQVYMKAKNKDISIQVEMAQDLTITHDAKWTGEAFVNILDNSIKYSPGHTAVTVRVTALVCNVLIEIEDEGIGIRKEDFTKIYQRFYRGALAKNMSEEGAGIGLYLARMILERQGGTISAKRRTGKGTVFKVTLPHHSTPPVSPIHSRS